MRNRVQLGEAPTAKSRKSLSKPPARFSIFNDEVGSILMSDTHIYFS